MSLEQILKDLKSVLDNLAEQLPSLAPLREGLGKLHASLHETPMEERHELILLSGEQKTFIRSLLWAPKDGSARNGLLMTLYREASAHKATDNTARKSVKDINQLIDSLRICYLRIYDRDHPTRLIGQSGSGMHSKQDPVRIEALYREAINDLLDFADIEAINEGERDTKQKTIFSMGIGSAKTQLKEAAECGHPNAMFIIGCAKLSGLLEHNGIEFDQDYPNDIDGGIAMLSRALDVEPNSSVALSLAYVYLYEKKDVATALNYFKRAVIYDNSEESLSILMKFYLNGVVTKDEVKLLEPFDGLVLTMIQTALEACKTDKPQYAIRCEERLNTMVDENLSTVKACFAQGKVDTGITFLRQAVRLAVDFELSTTSISRALSDYYEKGVKDSKGKEVLGAKDSKIDEIRQMLVKTLVEKETHRRRTMSLRNSGGLSSSGGSN